MKKILVYLPTIAKAVGGGVATQAEMTVSHAEKQGTPIVRYNPWETYNWDEFGAVHIFRADYETHNFAKLIKDKGIPLLVSPVFFSNHSPKRIRLLGKITSFIRKIFSGVRSDFDYVSEVVHCADQLFPNTTDESQLICDAFDIDSSLCTVVHNGVSDRFGTASPDSFIEKYGDKDIVLTVANLGFSRKNMLRSIKAMAKTDLPYYIIGPFYENSYGKECLRKINSTENIHYIGQLDNSDPLLAAAFANTKLFLLPSLFETPGIASMEAALAGAEIVTTPLGGTKDYFENLATYVDPYSEDSIREGVIAAVNKAPLNPKTHIESHFLWQEIGKKMNNIYSGYLK